MTPALAANPPVVTANQASPGTTVAPSWSFTADAGATTDCRLVSGATTVADWATCSTPYVADLSGQSDGTYTVEVRATDGGGSATTTDDYVLDTTAPSAPSITTSPVSPSTSRSPSWTFTVPEGSGECRLRKGATTVADWAACTSPYTGDLTGQADAAYTVEVRTVDTAGNRSAAASGVYTLDTTAPAAPTVSTLTASPGSTTAPQFSFSGEALSSAHCRVTNGASEIIAVAPCTSPKTVDLSSQADGTYTLEVYVTDQAGNDGPTGTASYVLDRAAPSSPTFTATPATPGKDMTPSWTFTGEAGASFTCKVDGPVSTGTYAACTSPYTPTLGQGDGDYQVSVRATDAAGNTGPAATSPVYTLDTVAPAVTSLSGPVSPGADTTPTFTFSVEAGATTACRVDGPAGVGTWAGCTSPFTPTLTGGDGTYVVNVRGTDQAGNTGVAATRGYTLDTTAPVAPGVTGPTGPSANTSVSWTFTAESGATTECRLVGPSSTTAWTTCTSPVTRTLSQGDGTYTLEVRATDGVGNTGSSGSSLGYVLDTTPPVAVSITAPTTPDNKTSVAFAFSSEAGATVTCRVVGPATSSAWAACTSPVTVSANQGDGTYTFEAKATDTAGNTGPVGAATYVLDTQAPNAPSVTGPSSPGNSAAVSYTFTAEAGATTECRLDGPAGTGTYVACSSPYAVTLGQGDGSYVLRVRATDQAGNTSTAGSSAAYVLDTAAPAAPSVSGPTTPGNTTAVSFSFSAEAGSTTSCRLVGPVSTSAWASCTSPTARTLSQGDGTYTLEVRATDAAGNTGATGSASYVLDTTPPSAPVVSGPAGPSNVTTVSWSFTTDAQTTTECRLVYNASPVGAWAACTSPRTTTLTSGDGTYTLQVRATDVAGNTGAAGASAGYDLDTTGPVAPTITSSPASPSTSRSPGWAFTLPEGTGECRLVRGATVIADWAACTSPKAYDLTGLVDGIYSFQVRAVDAVGNPGVVRASAYTLDTTAPAAPTVTTVTASPGTSTTPSWSFTGEAGSTAHCRLLQDGTPVGAFAACASPIVVDVSGRPDATYTLEVYVTDAAGNDGPTGSASYVLDRVAPATPTIGSGPASPGNTTSPSWSFSGESGATFRCRVDGPGATGTFAVCASPYTATLTQGDGTYSFLVTATDAAGNTGPAASAAYTLDTAAPAAPVLSGPNTPGQSATPTFTFTAEAGASTQCRLDGPSGAGTYATCTSPYAPTLTQGDGSYVVRVRATDAAGNTGAAASRTYVLDTTAPAAPVVSGPVGPSSTSSVTWTFTAEAGATTECRLVTPATTSPWGACTSPQTVALTDGDGTYTFQVRATDAAGNLGATGSSAAYTLDTAAPAAPTVTAPPSPGNATTVSVSFTAEAGATTRCRLVGPTTTTAWAACTSPRSVILNQGDGTYTFEVQATDAAGNVGPTGSAAYTLDTAAPAAPVVTGPVTPGNASTVTFSFTAESGATTTCRLDGPGGSSAVLPCTSPVTYTLTQGDGNYALRVWATDPAGNTSPVGAAPYRLDTTAPAAPVVTGPTSPGNAGTVSFSFTAEAGATTECRVVGPTSTSGWSACTSPSTVTLGQGDGSYSFQVRATDAAANTGGAGSATYVLDQTAPSAPVVSGPTGPSNVTTVTWTFTTDPGTTTECRRSRNGTPVTTWTSCTSPRTVTLVSGDGTYVLEVRATDTAGNLGPTGTSVGYVLDTTAPAAPAVSGPASPGNSTSATFTFTAEAGATTECQLAGPFAVSAWSSCTSPVTRSLVQGDGTYALRVRASDAAGNTGPSGAATYALDTVAPASPAVTSAPSSPGRSRGPSWSFTLPADGTGQCQVSRGATVVAAWAACTSPYVADLSGQVDGVYTFSVRAVDAAGNVSPAVTSTYTLDTTAPTSPVVAPPTGTTGNDTTPTWSWTAEPGASFECQLLKGTTTILARVGCTSPLTVDTSVTGGGEGLYTLSVWATDVAGNVGTPAVVTYLLDTTPPLAPTITGRPASISSSRSPTWTFSTESGATTQCRLTPDGATPGAWGACTTPTSYTANLTGLADGTYDFEVRAIDAAGNVGPSTTSGYVLDTTAPAAPTLASAPGSPSKLRTPSWSFTTEATATTTCQVTGPSGILDPTASCTSPYTANLKGAPDGVYTLRVVATDQAGNVGPALVVTYTLDSTAPVAPTLLSAPTGPSPDRGPTWSFTGEAGATFTCSLVVGATAVVVPSTCTSPFSADLTGRPDGDYVFSVTATDASGNLSAATTATYVLDTTPPAAPRFTRRPVSPDDSTAPSWSWSGVAGTVASCRLTRGSVTLVAWVPCTSPFVANLAAAPDGTYTLAVRLTDEAGNVGPAATSAYVLDTTAPGTVTFTSKPTSPGSDRKPTWGWGLPSGTTAECLLTGVGGVLRDWTACASSYTANLNGRPDGTYTLAVRLTDAAGNVGPSASSSYVLSSSTPPPSGGGGTPGTGGGTSTPPTTSGGTPPGTTSGKPLGTDFAPHGFIVPSPAPSPATLKPRSGGPEQSSSRPLFSPELPTVGDVPNVIGQVAVKSLEKPQFPLLLLVVVAIFLLVQNRIDRKDPKLATAPVDSEPLLGFGPVVESP